MTGVKLRIVVVWHREGECAGRRQTQIPLTLTHTPISQGKIVAGPKSAGEVTTPTEDGGERDLPNRCLKMPKARVELGEVTVHNIRQLKRLNSVVFPVSYNDKFYKDVLSAGELARLAYYNDVVVGGVCCRVDTTEGQRRLYIMTLGCLAPYRRLGIGTLMLKHVLNFVEADGNFDSIFLHVQVNNESAISFYQKFGFNVVETKPAYYKRIEPADAHVLQKTLRPTSTSSPAVNGVVTNGSSSNNPHRHHNGRSN